jgi:hypothetical protein
MNGGEVTLAELNRNLVALTMEVRKQNDEYDERIRRLEQEVTRLSERMTLWQAAQAAYTTIAGLIASLLGRIPP